MKYADRKDIAHLPEDEKQLRRNLQARVTRNRGRYEKLSRQLHQLKKTTDKSYSTWARADEELYQFDKERGLS